MTPDEIADLFLRDMERWYEGKRHRNGSVHTNVMTVGLVMIDHMAAAFPHDPGIYQTESQVRFLSGPRVRAILERHGETRQFTAEGGRTSRGSVRLAVELAEVMASSEGASHYIVTSDVDQTEVRQILQLWFVDRMRADYFDRQRIQAELDPRKPSRQAVAALMGAARERGGNTSGAVAQHLVGAKLSLRFPDVPIGNNSYTTADQQTDRPGDFLVGDTAIHVTVSPADNLMSNRCRANLHNGYRPLVLVPADRVEAARQLADNAGVSDRVAVVAIEDFVGTNVEEIAVFAEAGIRTGLRALLERYNELVRAVEPDPSLQIEIPGNL